MPLTSQAILSGLILLNHLQQGSPTSREVLQPHSRAARHPLLRKRTGSRRPLTHLGSDRAAYSEFPITAPLPPQEMGAPAAKGHGHEEW